MHPPNRKALARLSAASVLLLAGSVARAGDRLEQGLVVPRSDGRPADELSERVRSGVAAAWAAAQGQPETSRELLDQVARRYPAHLASVLLDLTEEPLASADGSEEPGALSEADFLQLAIGMVRRYGADPALISLLQLRASGPRSDDEPDAAVRAREQGRLAAKLQAGGEYTAAAAAWRLAAVQAHDSGDLWLEARARSLQASAEEASGRPEAALGLYEDAAEIARRIGDACWDAEASRGAGRSLLALGSAESALERFVAAGTRLREARIAAAIVRQAFAEAAGACTEIARRLLERGDPRGARAILERGSEYARDAQDEVAVAGIRVVEAELLAATGARSAAIALLRDSLEVFRRSGDDAGMTATT